METVLEEALGRSASLPALPWLLCDLGRVTCPLRTLVHSFTYVTRVLTRACFQ